MVSIRMAAETSPHTALKGDKIRGMLAFGAALVLLRMAPIRFTLSLAKFAKRGMKNDATRDDGERALATSDWVARYFPGRAACLEMSLTSFFVLASLGVRADWCIGCRFNPCESHAWIEVGGLALGEPFSNDQRFHVTVRV